MNKVRLFSLIVALKINLLTTFCEVGLIESDFKTF